MKARDRHHIRAEVVVTLIEFEEDPASYMECVREGQPVRVTQEDRTLFVLGPSGDNPFPLEQDELDDSPVELTAPPPVHPWLR